MFTPPAPAGSPWPSTDAPLTERVLALLADLAARVPADVQDVLDRGARVLGATSASLVTPGAALDAAGDEQALLVPLPGLDGRQVRLAFTARPDAAPGALALLGAALGGALRQAEERAALAVRVQRLEAHQQAVDSFLAFTEQSAGTADLDVLAQWAVQTVQEALGGVSAAYFERTQDGWTLRAVTADLAVDWETLPFRSVPLSAPGFAEAARRQDVTFIDDWRADDQQIRGTEAYHAAALYPCVVAGQPRGLLGAGFQRGEPWTAREQAIFRTVGERLAQAHARVDSARQAAAQHEELAARTRALEASAALTRDLTLLSEPDALIRRALEAALSLLPPGYAAYWQVIEGRWQATTLVGNVGSADLQATIDAGLLAGQTPTLDLPASTREPLFQDVYPHGLDTDPQVVSHVSAVATLPVEVSGEVRGVFNVPLFHARTWSAADRAVLVTIVRSLGLALESARGVQQIHENQRRLEAVNRELEAFAYSVSHDLRTPVRHIIAFSERLVSTLQGDLDERSARHLGIVHDAALRMNSLINGMLELARTTTQPLTVSPVDLSATVAQLRRELEPDQAGRTVRWELGRLPKVMGDPDALYQVMQNLLTNALKYSRTRDVAVIRIWAERDGPSVRVSVRDNGTGFDPKYAHRLFGVFQRLHAQEEFEGIGVGLANVRRIVNRHGGEVHATSEPDQGATFSFTLPRDPVG